MTTVVVTKRAGIACMAADTLATYGDTREDADLIVNSDKILTAGRAFIAPTGPASAQLVLRHFLQSFDEMPVLEDIDGIFDFLTQLQKALKDEYFVVGKEDAADDFESMRMEALIASPGGIFGCYPQRSVQEYSRFYAFGSGAVYALGAMHVAWGHDASAEQLARIGVEAAAAFDTSTALPMTLKTVALDERPQTGRPTQPVSATPAPLD